MTALEHSLFSAPGTKKSELGTRTAVFCIFGHLGTMAGGWIQAGLLQTLAGNGGLPAWKWIFIIVSVMTLPVAFFGAFHVKLKRKEINTSRLGVYSRPPCP